MEPSDKDQDLLSQELALKAVKAIGPGGPEPETAEETFWHSCRNFLRGWQRRHREASRHGQRPVLFVFSTMQLPDSVRPTAAKAPAFKIACPLKIGGKLYVCNENLREVREERIGFKDELEPLRFLEKEGLIACTAIVFLPEQDALLMHECNANLDDAVRLELGAVSRQPFKFKDLDGYLTKFYRQYVETHNGACDVWAKARERKLKPYAERQIQRSLKGFFDLTIAGQGAKIDQEIMTSFGRSDVRVLAYKDPMNWEQAIMELKVLQSSPDAKEWALEGIEQLLGYRLEHEKQTVACYLCCYDARSMDVDIPEVVSAAARHSFEHRRYFMKTPGTGMRG